MANGPEKHKQTIHALCCFAGLRPPWKLTLGQTEQARQPSIRITSVDWQQIYQNLSYNHSLSFDHPKTTLDKKIRCPNIGD